MNKLTMLPNELDTSKLKFSDVKTLDNGGKIMYVNYGENKSQIYMQTPKMPLQFDASYFSESSDSGKFSCKVSFNDSDNSDINAFKKCVEELDEKLIDEAVKNSKKWFSGKSISREALLQLYSPLLKYSINPESGEINTDYPPGFQFKVVRRNGNYMCKFYNENREQVNISNKDADDYVEVEDILKKGTSMTMLLQCNGLWFAGGKFGCTWKAVQIKSNKLQSLDDYAFREQDDTDDEVVDSDCENSP
jgi:hypothetical protein